MGPSLSSNFKEVPSFARLGESGVLHLKATEIFQITMVIDDLDVPDDVKEVLFDLDFVCAGQVIHQFDRIGGSPDLSQGN